MQKLNTTLVYILSVVGFLCCWCFGIGLVASIIAFVIASNELKKYAANPEAYSNGPAMKTAKTVALVALIISGLVTVYQIYNYATTTDEERAAQQQQIYDMMGIDDPYGE
ncbi:CCC motif membrane protein [Nonlabens xiamenensis]|uniref:CCC motif membrane protein n=1 Tax=Nonlabens xiamenensis TaxID=2341043 RepID=UPI000F60D71F|nr:CCC motif membrane protein [Nonlabens xiamenensis]